MNKKEEEFLERLQAMFKIEADEHVKSLRSGLIALEKRPDINSSLDMIEIVFREAHSLKGAARSVERNDIESICQEMENIFHLVKNQKFTLKVEHFDTIHQTIDYISTLVSSRKTAKVSENRKHIKQLKLILHPENIPLTEEEQDIDDTLSEKVTENNSSEIERTDKTEKEIEPNDLKDNLITSEKVTDSKKTEEKFGSIETVRIRTDKLDPIFLEAEQLIQSKISITQQLSELIDLESSLNKWKEDLEKSRKNKLHITDQHKKELIENSSVNLTEVKDNLSTIIKNVDEHQRVLGRKVDEHLQSIKRLLMLPISTILEGFPKLVRDLARSQNKDIELIITGESIEVDKRILEELKDPLVHIVRNCIDHGIKDSKQDTGETKIVTGKVFINISSPDGRNLEIIIKDNGNGIDTEKLLNSAIKQGIITEQDSINLNETEIFNLVFKSGISTSQMITDISGRGLGLAIVAEKVEKLGGKIVIDSKKGKGTTIKLLLPLTISTFRGVLIASNNQMFFISTNNVNLVIQVKKENIKTVENRNTVEIQGDILPVVNISDVLQIKTNNSGNSSINPIDSIQNHLQLVVLENDNKKIAFIVDQVLDEHQILVKNMGKQLIKVKNISGVSVLGTGKIVPVINVFDLMNSAINENRKTKAITDEKEEKVKRILVTEDSITSRTLIKEILESAGYYVDTAVDGLDGYIKAQSGNYDLFVSDVDMPRMNGFELTAKIKNDKNLSELPVVLVTSLGSKEDQEHGIDVGANAYIIKSSFEQSNLLETVNKLI